MRTIASTLYVFFLLLGILLLRQTGAAAFAENWNESDLPAGTDIYRAVQENVMLYRNPSATPANELFTLFQGYFVTGTEYDETFLEVRYQDAEEGYLPLLGYVRKADVVRYDGTESPEPLYPSFSGRALFNNTYLYENCDQLGVIGVLVKSQTVKCYGYLTRDDTVYVYVRCGSLFGYVRCTNLELDAVAQHPIPLPQEEKPDDGTEDPSDPGKEEEPARDDQLQVLLVVAIVVPSLIIVYILLRPHRKRVS